MDRRQLLDLYFVDARARLIDIAAFLDRLERWEGIDGKNGNEDFRVEAFRRALEELGRPGADRARRVLLALSDPTLEPIAKSPGKSACGAHDSHPSPSAHPAP